MAGMATSRARMGAGARGRTAASASVRRRCQSGAWAWEGQRSKAKLAPQAGGDVAGAQGVLDGEGARAGHRVEERGGGVDAAQGQHGGGQVLLQRGVGHRHAVAAAVQRRARQIQVQAGLRALEVQDQGDVGVLGVHVGAGAQLVPQGIDDGVLDLQGGEAGVGQRRVVPDGGADRQGGPGVQVGGPVDRRGRRRTARRRCGPGTPRPRSSTRMATRDHRQAFRPSVRAPSKETPPVAPFGPRMRRSASSRRSGPSVPLAQVTKKRMGRDQPGLPSPLPSPCGQGEGKHAGGLGTRYGLAGIASKSRCIPCDPCSPSPRPRGEGRGREVRLPAELSAASLSPRRRPGRRPRRGD